MANRRGPKRDWRKIFMAAVAVFLAASLAISLLGSMLLY